jgi:hypothetical protein
MPVPMPHRAGHDDQYAIYSHPCATRSYHCAYGWDQGRRSNVNPGSCHHAPVRVQGMVHDQGSHESLHRSTNKGRQAYNTYRYSIHKIGVARHAATGTDTPRTTTTTGYNTTGMGSHSVVVLRHTSAQLWVL